MDRRIYVAKIPLISMIMLVSRYIYITLNCSAIDLRWKLSVRVAIPLSCEEIKLLLSEFWVKHGQRNTMESAVPGSEERIFP